MKRFVAGFILAFAPLAFAQQSQDCQTVIECRSVIAQLKMQVLNSQASAAQFQFSLAQCQAPAAQKEVLESQQAVKAEQQKEGIKPALKPDAKK